MNSGKEEVASTDGDTPIRPGIEAFEHFYAREYSQVAALAYVLTGRRAVAEDVAQEAFMAAMKSWERIGHYDKPGAWVRRVVANQAVSLRRRTITEVRSLPKLLRRSSTSHSVDMDVEAQEVWSAVRSLPKRQAQVVALHYLDDLSVKDIGEILGCSTGSVKTHLARGRKQLGQVLGIVTDEEVDRHVG